MNPRPRLGWISTPPGADDETVEQGVVIGCTKLPFEDTGDALFKVATLERTSQVSASVDELQCELATSS